MTENRRIVLNVVATYSRALLGLACGLFASRWVLAALGVTDFGLFGVVGGIMAFIGFLNRSLAVANSRFYACSVGARKASADKEDALDECRRWFNVALLVHTLVPLLLFGIGYPVGVWLIRNWLTVPAARIEVCVTVFGYSCLSGLIGMMSVPFAAMYNAKQEIAESTLFSLFGVVANFLFAYYMVTHPGDWMVRFALWGCVLGLIPTVLMSVRAAVVFPECRLRWRYMLDGSRLRQLLSYAGWSLLAIVSVLLRTDGIVILINKAFGPAVNAAYSVAHNVDGKSAMLNESIKGAFAPAITQAYGAGDLDRMRNLAFCMCKFGLLSSLVFVLPLLWEIEEVLRLWLVTPPAYAAGLCCVMMVQHVALMSTQGFDTAVGATGSIAKYLAVSSGVAIMTLPVVGCAVRLGAGVYGMAVALAAMIVVYCLVRIAIAARVTGFSVREWLMRLILPLAAVSTSAFVMGLPVRLLLKSGIGRIVLTTAVVEVVFVPLAWRFVLDESERRTLKAKARGLLGRLA